MRVRGQDYDVVGFEDEAEFEEWVRARLAEKVLLSIRVERRLDIPQLPLRRQVTFRGNVAYCSDRGEVLRVMGATADGDAVNLSVSRQEDAMTVAVTEDF